MKRVYCILLLFLFSGCTSYSVPKKKELIVNSTPINDGLCAKIAVIHVQAKNDWEAQYLKALQNEFVSDIQQIEGITYLDNPKDTDSYFRVMIEKTPRILNEPYLMVTSLGVIPQPIYKYKGYKFSAQSSAANEQNDIDTTYLVTDWVGWFAPIISLFSGQTNSETLSNEMNHKKILINLRDALKEKRILASCVST